MAGRNGGYDSREFFGSADDLFARDKRGGIPEEAVPCPEWGGRKVLIRALAGPARRRFDHRRFDYSKPASDPERFRSEWFNEIRPYELVIECAVLPGGARLFHDADLERLMDAENQKPVQRLIDAALRVNGYDVMDLALSGKAAAAETTGGSDSSLPETSEGPTSVAS